MGDFDDIYGKYILDAPETVIGIKELNYAVKNNSTYIEDILQNWGVDTKVSNIEPNSKHVLYIYHSSYNESSNSPVSDLKNFRENDPSGGGFAVFLEEINETNNNAVYIRTKILQHFIYNKIRYVVLFGSVEEVATVMINLPSDWEERGVLNYNSTSAASDIYYGHVGNKEYKIIIGRLSSGDNRYGDPNNTSNSNLNTSQKQINIQNQVDKIKIYERLCTSVRNTNYLRNDETWVKHVVGIASNEGEGIGIEGKSDNMYMREELKRYSTGLEFKCTELYQSYYNSGHLTKDSNPDENIVYDEWGNPSSAHLSNVINSGAALLLYAGHADEITLSTTGFNVMNSTNISPNNKFFLGCVVGCSIGSHDERFMSLSEEFQVSKEKGSIAMFASSILQSWTAPMYMQRQVNTTILNAETTMTIGEIFQGSVENNDFKNNVDYYYYQLLGDPCTRFILTIPETRNMNIEGKIAYDNSDQGRWSIISSDGKKYILTDDLDESLKIVNLEVNLLVKLLAPNKASVYQRSENITNIKTRVISVVEIISTISP